MSRHNVAVALVRYRLAPAFRHPAPIEDAATAVAFLIRNADKYGYNSRRTYLAGHANGAHTASLLALNHRYLESHGIKAQSLAGVIGLNGVYDLNYARELASNHKQAIDSAFGADAAMRQSASPNNYGKADAPPFLILNSSGDILGAPVDGRKFADALRARGHPRVEQSMIAGRDHWSIIDMSGAENQARSLIFNFTKDESLPPALASLQTARRLWRKTNFSTLPFWQHQDLIRSHPIEPRFIQHLVSIYGPLKHELLEWPLETFYAIDLAAFLDRVYPGNTVKPAFIVTKNIRNEKQYWSRSEIAAHRPVIVVGIDDEKNLFRFSVFYRMLREYSWKNNPQLPAMARPLGAFIYFLAPPPKELSPQSAHYSLTHDSFQLVYKDPIEFARSLSKPVAEALTYRNGCLYCHTLRGVGSRAHHVVAATSAAHGGFALPLEEYPQEVWQTFVYRPEQAADRIGAIPNTVSEDARDELYRLIVDSRASRLAAKR